MRSLLLIVLTIVSFTSCFEIKEEVTMEKDGSGVLALTVDISESAPTLKTYLETAKMTGQNIPSQDNINTMMSIMEEHFNATDGMTNVQTVRNFDDYVFKIQGDFKDVEAMNAVMAKVTESFTRGGLAGSVDNFVTDGNTFSRLFPYPLDKIKFDEMGFMYQYMLESARFTNVYKFAQPIQAVSNEQAVLNDEKTEVRMQQSLASIIKGSGSLENDIDF